MFDKHKKDHKIVVLGDKNVGKTSIFMHYIFKGMTSNDELILKNTVQSDGMIFCKEKNDKLFQMVDFFNTHQNFHDKIVLDSCLLGVDYLDKWNKHK